jgi:glycosyltransferase involved in cell wall biosynthesis
MRIGFTICFNGLHHLLHNNYAEKLINMLDYWVIVEGATNNGGSTKWCKRMPDWCHNAGHSTDGTVEFLKEFRRQHKDKISIRYAYNGNWASKDAMVNCCTELIAYSNTSPINFVSDWFNYNPEKLVNNVFLWQIDADEQWTPEAMDEAEKQLDGDCGMFLCDYYVGKNLMAKDERPYKRLWRWKGQGFASHEPPVLKGGNGKEMLLPQRFDHYAYYYERDVIFKDEWYGGHKGIHKRWLELQKETVFPQPLSRLLPRKTGEICQI